MSKPGAASAKPALAGGIPQSAKKFVQSVKEIVPSADEDQIYTELKACGMDPNEAVQRLLNQGLFLHIALIEVSLLDQTLFRNDVFVCGILSVSVE